MLRFCLLSGAIVSSVSFSRLDRFSSFSPLKISSKNNPEIQVIQQPDEEFLRKRGVYDWPIWGCEESRFPWTYYETETCYLLQGQVIVTPSDGRSPVSFRKGDYVIFPAGMACVWDVKEAVQKHYMFN